MPSTSSVGDAEGAGARRRAGAGAHRRCARRRGEAVVLADEEHGQAEHRGPVQAFEERAAIGRAVAEDAADDAVLAAQLDRVRGAGGDDDVRRHHAVRAEHADAEIGDVHRAALAAAAPADAAEQLAHHRRAVGALGERVAVAAMGGEQDVLAREQRDHAGGDRLLPDRGVDGAEHELVAEAAERRLLERANAEHQAVMRPQALDIDVAPLRRGFLRHVPASRLFWFFSIVPCHDRRGAVQPGDF